MLQLYTCTSHSTLFSVIDNECKLALNWFLMRIIGLIIMCYKAPYCRNFLLSETNSLYPLTPFCVEAFQKIDVGDQIGGYIILSTFY